MGKATEVRVHDAVATSISGSLEHSLLQPIFNPAQPLYHRMRLPAFGWLAISVDYRMIYFASTQHMWRIIDARERSLLSTDYRLQNGDRIGHGQALRITECV